jgi:uncharacterized protein (DUF362 family)
MDDPLDDKVVSRREFLIRLTKAGAAIGVAGAVSGWLYDGSGPAPPSVAESGSVVLPDFSVSAMDKKMSIIRGADRIKSLHTGLKALGGIESFIKKDDRVLIKVNAAFATPAILSATTNPDLLAEVCRLCLKAGAVSVAVTDNPINDPESCFALTGLREAATLAGARVILPRAGFFRPTTVTGGALIKDWPLLVTPFQGITKLISIAPVKDHHRSGASMVMKNWYGFLGGRRNIFHQDIHNTIKELAMMVKPTLVILDGTTTMMTNGPTGGSLSDLKPTNTLILGTDQVAADAVGATLLGKSILELPFILKAAAAGVGSADVESLNPVRAQAV